MRMVDFIEGEAEKLRQEAEKFRKWVHPSDRICDAEIHTAINVPQWRTAYRLSSSDPWQYGQWHDYPEEVYRIEGYMGRYLNRDTQGGYTNWIFREDVEEIIKSIQAEQLRKNEEYNDHIKWAKLLINS